MDFRSAPVRFSFYDPHRGFFIFWLVGIFIGQQLC